MRDSGINISKTAICKGEFFEMNSGHHLILGELVDFITGETIEDTHDEMYRLWYRFRLKDTLKIGEPSR